ncbi:hypothetical protein NSU18_15630 [Paenibacillus sp. FSL H8-0048]|uniref:hypothetical protein n=1 Tax=Paenibacillus sp. FSL H8-0048 TaxID=2954508 RepID=UPI0030F8A6B0
MSNSLNIEDKPAVSEAYWDELLVSHERIKENYSETDKVAFTSSLNATDIEALQSILQLSNFDEAEKWKQNLSERSDFLNFLYLKDFLQRKKKSIDEIFKLKLPDYSFSSVSPLIKLIILFYTDSNWLFEIFVLHEWRTKASGDLYIAEKKLTDMRNKLSQDHNFHLKLVDTMRQNSGYSNDYRVVAHCDVGEKQTIYLLYKKIKDSKKPGYDQNKRIKDRDQIMFSVDIKKQSLEVKAPHNDVFGIKKYFDQEFNTALRKMENELFVQYKIDDVVQLFKEGTPVVDEEPEDFTIDSITFSNSLLIKSPDVKLQLKGSDIWPSINDAFRRGIINLYNLKDIKKINFRSEQHSKSILSIPLEDGSVIFKLNDSSLSEQTRSAIKKKFFMKFGFPLDQPVQNKFDGGEAFKVDQIFRFANINQITNDHKDIYDKLRFSKLIDETEEVSYSCSHCSFTTNDTKLLAKNDNGSSICPECDEPIYQKIIKELNPNSDNIYKFIYSLIDDLTNKHENFKNAKISNQKFKKKEFTFKRFSYKNRPYQLLVTDSLLSKKTLEWIEKKLVPTLIVCYGIDKQTSNRYALDTIEQVTFGELYIYKEKAQIHEIFEEYLNDLEKRTHHQVVSAATKATKNLSFIGDKTVELKEIYDEDMLEDDVYTLIKHLFPNSEKWGKEYSGSTVPEGIFTIQYKENSGVMSVEHKHGFTYDCKFTLDRSGYKLGSSENRKALHYIKLLNELVDVSTYCSSGELTSHIFVGNKFRERQVQAMAKFIRKEIAKGHYTKPVFINSKDLSYLYDQFIYNKNKVDKVPDIFYKQLAAIFSTDEIVITKEYIDEKLEDVEIAARSYSILDTSNITRKLTGRKK